MAKAKVGDIKYYHESGNIFEVEVLDVQERNYGKTIGEEYKLRLLGVVSVNNTENPLNSGLEFAVWKSKEDGAYCGWALLDK